ncbi:MAG: cadherin domain-containing protein [SAR324 cluster bacterium]|nr:cadherin domain-containing protein [SAR324 cluster bacterium]
MLPITTTTTSTTTTYAPTDISLSASSVRENQSSGTTVGTLSCTDADSSSFTYSIIAGSISSYAISSDSLVTAKILDYELASTQSVTIRCSDSDSNTYDEAFTISIADTINSEAYLKASGGNGSDDYFGYSVAISGNTVVVGVPPEDSAQTTITNGTTAASDNAAGSSGAVYVFTRSGSSWTQEAYLKAPNATQFVQFGGGSGDYIPITSSVALSGNTYVVGSYYELSDQTTITNGTTAASDNGGSSPGAVYIFKD